MNCAQFQLQHYTLTSSRSPSRKRFSEHEKHILRTNSFRCTDHRLLDRDIETASRLILLCSMDDDFTLTGTQPNVVSEMQEASLKSYQPVKAEDLSSGLIQSLHDAARATELAVTKHISSGNKYWFPATWLGVDRNAWIKTFSYQVAVYSMLQAKIDISSRLDGQDKCLDMFVQRSLMRLSAPLESVIRHELSSRQPDSYDWFWSHQQPMLLISFINLLQSNSRWECVSSRPDNARRLLPLKHALSCIVAITKLGSAKVSCTELFSLVPVITDGLMEMLVDVISIQHAYSLVKNIGLQREFLLHFGSRAGKSKAGNEDDVEEIAFWIDHVQKQLQRAINRERIWSRLTTCERIEVLEKDLAIFGFFIALGRSTQVFLSANGFSATDYKIEGIIRYLIGGSVLYYPQLSSISSYQIYVEVVCEELDWLPFYGTEYTVKPSHDQKSEQKERLSRKEVISEILDVCSHWTKSFIKYSLWLDDPLNTKAAEFLSTGQNKLIECRNELRKGRNELSDNFTEYEHESTRSGSDRYSTTCIDLDKFDKALESVEQALNRLEGLLQELHLSSSTSKRQHLEAACSHLQRIRKLKKEAEFLEASFRAKAASLKEDNDVGSTNFSSNTRIEHTNRNNHNVLDDTRNQGRFTNRAFTKFGGLWNFLQHSNRKMESQLSRRNLNATTSGTSDKDHDLNEIERFEVLRNELINLEKRVQKSNSQMAPNEDCTILEREDSALACSQKLVKLPNRKENIIAQSINKLKETTNHILQGTQLLAVDTLAATVLIKRALTGDELAGKEKQALQRTMTDLASVIPIGILMLLPVTAVGHAAILAGIQRYLPALIPSTYSQERLSLFRQLEKVKEMKSGDINTDEHTHP